MERFTLAGGCFWCLDSAYTQLQGIGEVTCGYAGGHDQNPNYESVCNGSTGHAEVVAIEFDPEVISREIVLDVFFTVHDPTQLNRQGHDVGTQYRSAMFYESEEQRLLFERAIEKANENWVVAL